MWRNWRRNMLRGVVQEVSTITEWKRKSAVALQVLKEPPTLSQLATLFHGVHGLACNPSTAGSPNRAVALAVNSTGLDNSRFSKGLCQSRKVRNDRVGCPLVSSSLYTLVQRCTYPHTCAHTITTQIHTSTYTTNEYFFLKKWCFPNGHKRTWD